jgi:aromatic ring-opening dioxygenase catalytic subunit (LigB family)
MKYPTVFVNHGGGPLPLMGRQPELVKNMKYIVKNLLPETPPSAIVVLSAHWESNPVSITSSTNPSLLFDYYGFPNETYAYKYPAPGDALLAQRIQNLLEDQGVESLLDDRRGLDHGVFVPLMIMYPAATIPVVQVSLDASLDAAKNIEIGKALAPLRDDNILILGSGYTFHNMEAFFNPSKETILGSRKFNEWLKYVILTPANDVEDGSTTQYATKMFEQRMKGLQNWQTAPGARISHPREEHLLPLFIVAAAAGEDTIPKLIYDTSVISNNDSRLSEHAVSGYLFV